MANDTQHIQLEIYMKNNTDKTYRVYQKEYQDFRYLQLKKENRYDSVFFSILFGD
jgi:hypothetical protein